MVTAPSKPRSLTHHFFGLDRCICGHIRLMHQTHGSCACEGHLTLIDTGGDYEGPCFCHAFRLKGLKP